MSLADRFDAVLLCTCDEEATAAVHARVLAPRLRVLALCMATGKTTGQPSWAQGLDSTTFAGATNAVTLTLLEEALRRRDIRRPLLWILDPLYWAGLCRARSDWCRVMYLAEPAQALSAAAACPDVLQDADLVVAGSEETLHVLRQAGQGARVLLAGIDADAAVQPVPEDALGRIEADLAAAVAAGQRVHRRLNVLVLYDDRETHINTVFEHLDSFRKYSRHAIHYLPATSHWPDADEVLARNFDFSAFDAVIVHYAVRLSLPAYFTEAIAARLERFDGLKLLFIQDEYENTETARRWIERLRFDVVYTCVPAHSREAIYPHERFARVAFVQTLTGYVPDNPRLDRYVLPLSQRHVAIAYRGRRLHPVYGELGQEKTRIGIDVKRMAIERGLRVDIEVDDDARIYGADAWYRFLGSARATLATASGANVFDFDGSLRRRIDRLMEEQPDIGFEALHARVLAGHEGRVRMDQISPKVFEAIRLRTALIMFEGEYSGVVRPHEHYLPLRKDYANIDEVFERLADDGFIEAMTERAWRDIIGSGRYSYRHFMSGVDDMIDARVLRGPRCTLYATPALARRGDSVTAVLPRDAIGFTLTTAPLGGALQREQLRAQMGKSIDACADRHTIDCPGQEAAPARRNGRVVAQGLRRFSGMNAPDTRRYRVARRLWRTLPFAIRRRLAAMLGV